MWGVEGTYSVTYALCLPGVDVFSCYVWGKLCPSVKCEGFVLCVNEGVSWWWGGWGWVYVFCAT
jgi:hypothetical protein